MKAAIFHGPHQPLTTEQVEIDKPIDHEVLVRVVASGVCHSDLHFVDVVIQSYRHRFGYAPGDPALEPIEVRLAAQPSIGVPTINLHGADDGVTPLASHDWAAPHFDGPYERRVIPGVGHNLPQESPAAVVGAVRALLARG